MILQIWFVAQLLVVTENVNNYQQVFHVIALRYKLNAIFGPISKFFDIKQGVKGRNCDQLLYSNENPCLINPCWNGGTCSVVGGDWSCACSSPFFGRDCKGITTSPCISNNPCKNSGICQLVGGVGMKKLVKLFKKLFYFFIFLKTQLAFVLMNSQVVIVIRK